MKRKGKRKGAGLVYVIMIMMIVSIMAVTIVQLSMTNTRQSVVQEQSLRAYYVARSGAELTYEVLATDPVFINTLRTSSIGAPAYSQNDFVIGNGKVNIVILPSEELLDAHGFPIGRVIEVQSTGRLTKAEDIERRIVLRFDIFQDPSRGIENIRWSY